MSPASASTLSWSVVRTLRGEEGLPKMFCLVASSLGHHRSQCSTACGSSLQSGHKGVCGGVAESGIGFHQCSVAGSQARKEDRVRCGLAILGPGEPAIYLRCPWVCLWWIYKCFVDEGSLRSLGNGHRRVIFCVLRRFRNLILL